MKTEEASIKWWAATNHTWGNMSWIFPRMVGLWLAIAMLPFLGFVVNAAKATEADLTHEGVVYNSLYGAPQQLPYCEAQLKKLEFDFIPVVFYFPGVFWIAYKIKAVTDGVWLKTEFRFAGWGALLASVVYLTFENVPLINNFIANKNVKEATMTTMYFILALASFYIPSYAWYLDQLKRKSQELDETKVPPELEGFEKVILHSEARKSLKEFLVSEFSVENMLFLDEYRELRSVIVVMNLHDPAEKQKLADMLTDFFVKYIEDGAEYQVNIRHDHRFKMKKALDTFIAELLQWEHANDNVPVMFHRAESVLSKFQDSDLGRLGVQENAAMEPTLTPVSETQAANEVNDQGPAGNDSELPKVQIVLTEQESDEKLLHEKSDLLEAAKKTARRKLKLDNIDYYDWVRLYLAQNKKNDYEQSLEFKIRAYELFHKAKVEVWKLLARDSYARYIYSDLWIQFLKGYDQMLLDVMDVKGI